MSQMLEMIVKHNVLLTPAVENNSDTKNTTVIFALESARHSN